MRGGRGRARGRAAKHNAQFAGPSELAVAGLRCFSRLLRAWAGLLQAWSAWGAPPEQASEARFGSAAEARSARSSEQQGRAAASSRGAQGYGRRDGSVQVFLGGAASEHLLFQRAPAKTAIKQNATAGGSPCVWKQPPCSLSGAEEEVEQTLRGQQPRCVGRALARGCLGTGCWRTHAALSPPGETGGDALAGGRGDAAHDAGRRAFPARRSYRRPSLYALPSGLTLYCPQPGCVACGACTADAEAEGEGAGVQSVLVKLRSAAAGWRTPRSIFKRAQRIKPLPSI